eukprot:gnl/TRDRNA2_/TRDRNA2_189863_c0_seq1.p1 gnl/TRDRNA2_/TRDRNA2_189863_c0~~gnl/TRDRNA2_/TRDRNA2_189863_c0_seq1.p1  ORF type:complete len:464 (-),score=101.82 gnl/TRDRNA2_/TRDRNA2_189863_c0_seq1:41-1324(-)
MVVERVSARTFSAAVASTQGLRVNHEDDHIIELLDGELEENAESAAILAVLDGHGGSTAATISREILARELRRIASRGTISPQEAEEVFQEAFLEADAELRSRLPTGDTSGTTVVSAVVTQPSPSEFCVHLIHAGDSRAVLKCGKQLHATEDHKPDGEEETRRIKAAGGKVEPGMFGGPMRVDGKLAVARSFGDFAFKPAGLPAKSYKVSAFPDVQTVVCHPGDWLVLACDGVFDVMSNDDVQHFVDSNPSTENGELMVRLLRASLAKGSRDNCTGLIVHFTAGDTTPVALTRELLEGDLHKETPEMQARYADFFRSQGFPAAADAAAAAAALRTSPGPDAGMLNGQVAPAGDPQAPPPQNPKLENVTKALRAMKSSRAIQRAWRARQEGRDSEDDSEEPEDHEEHEDDERQHPLRALEELSKKQPP